MFAIEALTIKNFRSILNERIETSQFTVFVGNNDAGKSNVLKAMNLFFNGETDYNTKFDFTDDFCKFAKVGAKQASEITISLTIKLPSSYSDKQVVWTKAWRKENSGSIPNSTEIRNPARKDGKLGKRTRAFLRNISFRYVPTIKSDDYFQYLLGELYDSISESASGKFAESSHGFTDTIQALTKAMSENIKNSLKLESKLIIDYGDFFRTLKFQTSIDEKNTVHLRQRGDGIRTRHIPEILYFIHESAVKNTKKRAVSPNTIWGYEEPETAIELSKCFEFANDFFRYSNSVHIFITTHSPAYYSLAEKEEKAKLYFVDNGSNGTSFEEENAETIHNHLGLMQLIAPLMAEKNKELLHSQEELLRAEKALERLQKSSRPIVYVEGKTDKLYLEKYIELCKIELNVEIIDGGGKDKMNGNYNVWKSHCDVINTRLVFLYDCDVERAEGVVGNKLFIRVANYNENEEVYKVGAENLLNLPDDFIYDDFKNTVIKKETRLGEKTIVETIDKVKLANFICNHDDALKYLENWAGLVMKIQDCLDYNLS